MVELYDFTSKGRCGIVCIVGSSLYGNEKMPCFRSQPRESTLSRKKYTSGLHYLLSNSSAELGLISFHWIHIIIVTNTCHYSFPTEQGMTLDCVEISLGRAFENGQAYVALSRARNLQSLRVRDFNPACVRAHPDVLDFYRGLRRMRRNYIEERGDS